MRITHGLFGKCFAALFTAGLFMTGLSGTARSEGVDLTILGGGSGGLWAIISEGVGETVRRSLPEARVTVEPGKDGPNQVMTGRNEVPLAIATDVLTLQAIRGEGPFKGRKLEDLRLMAVMNPTSALQFFVDAKTGIKNIQDIKEKKYPLRICVNRAGTLIDVATEKLLESYGISYKDIESWGGKVLRIPGPEAMDLWDAGQMDAIVEISQFPTSRFFELGQKHDLLLLPVDSAHQEKLNAELGTTSVSIPASTYPFQKEDCPTLCTQLLLITNAKQSDEVITGVLKAISCNLDYLHNVHANLRDLSLKTMNSNTSIPMHPAAARFYSEQK